MKIMVVNAGSSSLKYQLFDMESTEVLAKGLCERIGIDGKIKHKSAKGEFEKEIAMPNHAAAIKEVIDAVTDAKYGCISSLDEISAVGHRIVHGGDLFTESVLVDEKVLAGIDQCSELAPLHNPGSLTGIKACMEVMKDVPQVGVFDTAFHQTMPPKAYMYPLPYEYYEKYKVRRYGFHGTSHRYVSQRAAAMLGKKPEEIKVVTCHLGNGSSIAAVDCGKVVDTSMGFTPLAGLLMGTRCGDVDPAVVTYIMQKENLSSKEMDTIMNKKSGALGLSGVSSDFRDVEAHMGENERCKLVLDIVAYQVKKYIGSYAAAMGGLDAVVFTAGIGENNTWLREDIVSGLEFMGIKIDHEKNQIRGKETDVSAQGATVRTLVIPTNEELMIARDTQAIVSK